MYGMRLIERIAWIQGVDVQRKLLDRSSHLVFVCTNHGEHFELWPYDGLHTSELIDCAQCNAMGQAGFMNLGVVSSEEARAEPALWNRIEELAAQGH